MVFIYCPRQLRLDELAPGAFINRLPSPSLAYVEMLSAGSLVLVVPQLLTLIVGQERRQAGAVQTRSHGRLG